MSTPWFLDLRDPTVQCPKKINWPLAIVTFLAVLFAFLVVVYSPESEISLWLFSITVAVVSSISILSPTIGAIGFALMLQLPASFPWYSSPFLIVALLVVCAIIAYRSTALRSGLLIAMLWYSAQVELGDGEILITDLEVASFLLLLLSLAWVSGSALRRSGIRRLAEAERHRAQILNERENTLRALHGSVATSLTSVVLRSESLAMESDADIAETAQKIADDARRAMVEVRELIGTVRPAPPTEGKPVNADAASSRALESLTLGLTAHGFDVISSGLQNLTTADIPYTELTEICRELEINLIKYAAKDAPVVVAAEREDNAFSVLIQNKISQTKRKQYLATGMGLKHISDLAGDCGATLSSDRDGDTWRTYLKFPKNRSDVRSNGVS